MSSPYENLPRTTRRNQSDPLQIRTPISNDISAFFSDFMPSTEFFAMVENITTEISKYQEIKVQLHGEFNILQ